MAFVGFECPECRSRSVKVIDSRFRLGRRIRRRVCESCRARFSTLEMRREEYEELRRAASLLDELTAPGREAVIGVEIGAAIASALDDVA